ncbi:hypothetical protein LAJ19_17150 (plasmid) [Deinococcus taeanensis]|uniref:hypothetical protein n=1 Tax=Deinococcus taeanensis TaxID=2737050 RepID=UPI001CDB96DE|nr:hypothetical protein [Deinococcus taeanensis]UBV44507.1 hypothetical protein LAJ19_17150 [Deinococcus taeanensis]
MNPLFRLGRALLGAALIIGIAVVLQWLQPVYISKELSIRLMGAVFGLVVVVNSNAIPKTLGRRWRVQSGAAAQAARRVAGWSMVLGGMGYMLASLFAPPALAFPVSAAILLTALFAATLRVTRIGTSCPRQ